MLEQIRDRGGEVMVRIHQPVRAGDDAVPVGVGIVGEGDIELVAHADQPRHRIGRRAVHPDLAVPIGCHEPERRVHGITNDGRGDAVSLDDGLPEMHSRAAQGIDPDLHPRSADRFHVDDVGKVGHVRTNVIVAMNASSLLRAVIRNPLQSPQSVFQKCVCGALNSRRDIGVSRSAIWRIIFEAAILGRVMGRGDHDAIGKAAGPVPVVGQDRMRDRGRRRISVPLVNHHGDIVGREYLQRAGEGALRQGMGVDAHEQRAVDAAAAPMVAERLADRQNVRLVEGVVKGGAAMPRGPERHAL